MIILSTVTICKRYLCDLYPPSVVAQIRPGQMDLGNSAEACGFDFTMSSSGLGQIFCELHHIRPLASASKSYGTKTKLDDLSILCSNCHRMIHRKKPMGSVEELSQRILKMRQADKYPSIRFPNETLNGAAKAQFM
ncbi:HNH endonuclease [Aeromonas sanarellii]|uniref:HNH endonuclease n=1 Tax=Aeromonas sanarellii TaxID=633415 RepID=UPI0038CFD58F